jgi:hypothetical protein
MTTYQELSAGTAIAEQFATLRTFIQYIGYEGPPVATRNQIKDVVVEDLDTTVFLDSFGPWRVGQFLI